MGRHSASNDAQCSSPAVLEASASLLSFKRLPLSRFEATLAMLQGLIRHTGHKVEASIACASAISVEMVTPVFLDTLFHSCSVLPSAKDASTGAAQKDLHCPVVICVRRCGSRKGLACFSVSVDFYFLTIQWCIAGALKSSHRRYEQYGSVMTLSGYKETSCDTGPL
jgi:hypothetical protein